MKEKIVDEILSRGVIVGVLPDKESFRQRLLSPKPMRIYIGADPTSGSLHLSHAKNYMILEEFRKLGHEVIVLFGDFTARIGDPTDRLATRKQLTRDEVVTNVQAWLKQIEPLMDFNATNNPPRVVYNHDWLSKLTMEDVVNLSANVTVQQMLERDMFAERLKQKRPIYLHEFLYPLMQGYDSVALDVDAELCGTDQTFNALVGRTLLKKIRNKEKFVVTVNLMENPVTGELMSKSRGTGIFLNLDPFNMYGAIMSQPDEMIKIFLINNTRVPLDEVESILRMENPRDAKARTAFEITKIFHGEAKATEAQVQFVRLVQNKEDSSDIPEIHVGTHTLDVFGVLRKCLDSGTSNSGIRRLLEQRSIKAGDAVVTDGDSVIHIPDEGIVLKVGKKKWFKVLA